MFDSKGILHKGRTDLNKYKAQFALSEDMTMTEASRARTSSSACPRRISSRPT